jgi:hypothetical protein
MIDLINIKLFFFSVCKFSASYFGGFFVLQKFDVHVAVGVVDGGLLHDVLPLLRLYLLAQPLPK